MNFTKNRWTSSLVTTSTKTVVCRYPTSRFLGHTSTEDLKKEFEEGIQELDMKKMVQVSCMDPMLVNQGKCLIVPDLTVTGCQRISIKLG